MAKIRALPSLVNEESVRLMSRTGLSWVQLSRGTQSGEQGDRVGQAVSRQGTKIGWRLPQLDPCYLYIDYGTRV